MQNSVLKQISLIGSLFFLFSCQSNSPESAVIHFEEVDNCHEFSKCIENIEFIPLETDDDHILGFSHDLYLAYDGTYVISDTNNGSIYRYSSSGSFLNEIGHRGNGPSEYQNITNIQVISDVVYVYSTPGKRLSYSLNGDFLSEDEFDDLGTQTFTTEKGVLTYFGFGSGRGHRFGLYKQDSPFEYQIPSLENVINLTANTPIFREFDGQVFVADSYNENVMVFESGKIQPYCSFDFGEYAIKSDFYSYDSAMDAMQSLMSQPFALINSYQESESYSYVEVNIQGGGMPKRSYGLKYNDKWHWFSLGSLDKEPLAGQVYLLDSDTLYCMMDPSLVGNLQSDILRKAINPDSLKGLSTDSNYVIAKIKLL